MKRFHFPTLIMHILLLLLARLTINDYPDFFLGISCLVLIFHVAWAIESKGIFLIAHCMGICLYGLSKSLGLVRVGTGFFEMGGEFAWLFYGIALAVSFAVISILHLIRWIKSR